MSSAASPWSVRRVARGVKRRAVRIMERRKLAKDRRCVICGEGVWVVDLTATVEPKRTCRMEICSRCGHVSNPANTHDYAPVRDGRGDARSSRASGPPTARAASSSWPKMAIDILGRTTSTSSSTAPGGASTTTTSRHCRSVRARRDRRRDRGLRDDAEFYRLEPEPATRQFAVVDRQRGDRALPRARAGTSTRLFGFVQPDGMLVCSTNVYDGGDSRAPVATSSRTVTPRTTPPASLAVLAEANGLAPWTSRTPLVATGYGGARKRYVLFTASPSVREAIQAVLRGHEYAPSESPP